MFSFSKLSYYRIGVILLAFCFSWLSPLIISKLLGNNVFEPFLLVALFFLASSPTKLRIVMFSVFTSGYFKMTLMVMLLVMLLGFIYSGGSNFLVYADFRSNLAFVFTYFLLINQNWQFDERKLFLLDILPIVAIMDFLALLLRPLLQTQDDGNIKEVISIVIPSLLTIYYFKHQKYGLTLLYISLMAFEAAVGFLRSYYVVVIITVLLIAILYFQELFSTKQKKSDKAKMIFFLLVIASAVFISIPIVTKYWTDDPARTIHSINRSEELLDGSATESERVNSIIVLVKEPGKLFLPHGVGWRNFVDSISKEYKSYTIISTMDSSIFYIAYHYGLIVTGFIIIFFFKGFVKLVLKKNLGTLTLDKKCRYTLMILFLSSFFTSGAMFTTPQMAFAYATLYSLSIYPI